MEGKICEKTTHCPIFNKGVFVHENSGQTYKNLYCLNSGKYKTCKKYMVANITGLPVPEYIMPNSPLSVEAIISRISKT